MMTDKRTDLTDLELDDLFASARTVNPDPTDDFMGRLFADIDDVADGFEQVTLPTEARRSLLASLWAALGGWAGASGLAAAAAAGLWIGISPPSSLSSVTDVIWADSVDVSLFASEDILGLEG